VITLALMLEAELVSKTLVFSWMMKWLMTQAYFNAKFKFIIHLL
jgi:hypothetical protein